MPPTHSLPVASTAPSVHIDSPAVAAARRAIAESRRAEDNATAASYATQEGVLLSRDDARALLAEIAVLRAAAEGPSASSAPPAYDADLDEDGEGAREREANRLFAEHEAARGRPVAAAEYLALRDRVAELEDRLRSGHADGVLTSDLTAYPVSDPKLVTQFARDRRPI